MAVTPLHSESVCEKAGKSPVETMLDQLSKQECGGVNPAEALGNGDMFALDQATALTACLGHAIHGANELPREVLDYALDGILTLLALAGAERDALAARRSQEAR